MFARLLTFYLCLALIKDVQNVTVFKPSNIVCTTLDKALIEITQCRIKALKRGVTDIYFYAKLLQIPVDNVTIYVSLSKRGQQHRKPLLEYTVDCCLFMRSKKQNPLAAIVYKLLGFTKYTNMNHSCPYDHDLIIDGMRFSVQELQMLMLPFGEYTFNSHWSVWNVPRVNASINFKFSEE